MSIASSPARTNLSIAARTAILIVEDEIAVAQALQRALIDLGFDAYAIASSAVAAVRHAADRCPDLVMMDTRIKGPLDGIETASILRRKCSTAIVFLMAHADPAMIERARETEPYGYLMKPVGVVELRIAVEIALYKRQLDQARRQHEESLRLAVREAERANGAKSLFLAHMSHEIRTPMNAVIGLTYLLEQTSLDSKQTELVAQINIASKSLLALTSDVLDLSKIEAGEWSLSRVVFGPRDLLDGLLAVMRVPADRKGITLQFEVAEDLPAALQGDAARLNQILTNLLSNAIKFTERGSVTLCLRLLGSACTGSTLAFTVRDTGIGIAPEAQAQLFTPFMQADESITRRYGGTGLGLSITNSLVKRMGGTFDFTSTEGVGSEFRVVLEFAYATAESPAARSAAPISGGARPLAGVRVLVVDDYDLNLVVVRGMLEQAGALVWLAKTGQDAFEQLQLRPGHFDVVLMDVQMPVMDGCEATQRIRAALGMLDLPIIGLTAGALASEGQRAMLAGMNDCIIKPFDAATLISSVEHHIGRAGISHQPRDFEIGHPQAAVAWPEIEGIDTQSARRRWCDDLAVFRSMLEDCLDEFADIAVPSSWSLAAGLGSQAVRLHKLRGGACLLAAHTIESLAAEAEAACLAGDAGRTQQLAIGLAARLEALRASAAQAFAAAEGDLPLSARDLQAPPVGKLG